jgi:hypothetical protein
MNRHTVRFAFIFLLASVLPVIAQDMSISFESKNGSFSAILTKKPDRSYLLEVYDKKTNYFLWDSWAEWNDRKQAFLSEDGRFIVMVTPYYVEDENVIEIYRDGLPLLFNGKVLKMKLKDLLRDSGKYIWIHMAADPVRFNYTAKGKVDGVEFDLVDSRTVIIPLK